MTTAARTTELPDESTERGNQLVIWWGARQSALFACLVAVSAAIGWGLFVLARHVDTGNSDGATVVLEGKAVVAGHVLLGGWSLSLDSFWTVDVVFYTLAVAIDGLSGTLLTLVPAVIAALVVLVCLYLALDGQRGIAGAAGASVAALLLAFPSKVMALFFVQGPLHVGTLLWCLVAFVLLDRRRFDARFVLAVVLLAAGILGDLQTLLLGIAPLLLGALVLGHLYRDLRAVRCYLGAPVAAGVLAVLVREIAKAAGTFAVPRTNTFASGHQLFRNIAHLPSFFLDLLGVTQGPFSPTALPLGLRLLHLLAALFVVGAPLVVGVDLLVRARRVRGATEVPANLDLDVLLLLTFLASLATFVLLPITDSDAYARYLVPAVVTGAALAGRLVARRFSRSDRRVRLSFGAVLATLAAMLGASYGLELSGAPAPDPGGDLGAFLVAHGLHHGIGDYWDASVVTVESKGAVTVRPVIASGRVLVRYDKQSASSWYGSGERFNFLVFNSGAIWNGVDARRAIRTFGHPTSIYPDGTYRVYVWSRPFTVSMQGSTGP